MKYIRIFWQLLRYRVAVMLSLFLALGMARHNGFEHLSWRYLVALLLLMVMYVSATSFNDLADEDIDRINHAGKPGRLLITGEANRRQLAAVGIVSCALMLLFGFFLGWLPLLLTAISLVINVVYSLPPLRLSYRTFMVPFVLAVAYVGVPFVLGVAIAKGRMDGIDWLLFIGLYCLFLARINLKDFRDRTGDAKFGKPTLLLRFGKPVTIGTSYLFLVLGIIVTALSIVIYGSTGIILVVLSGVIIGVLLLRLLKAPEGPYEQVVIGVAAKLGNGLLLIVLAVMLVNTAKIPLGIEILVLAMLFVGSLANLTFLSRDPRQVLESYRG